MVLKINVLLDSAAEKLVWLDAWRSWGIENRWRSKWKIMLDQGAVFGYGSWSEKLKFSAKGLGGFFRG